MTALAAALLSAGMLSDAGQAWALQADWGVGYRGEFTNNSYNTPDNEEDEWVNVGTLDLALEDSAARRNITLESELEFRQYTQDTYSDEALFSLDALGTFELLPGRLTWLIEDHFDQTSIQYREVVTPDNRQDVNLFTTGPTMSFRLSPVSTLQLEGLYENFYTEESEIDHDRVSGAVHLLHRRSETTDWGAHLEATTVEFDNQDEQNDFDRQDAYVSIAGDRELSEWLFELGGTRIKLDDAPPGEDDDYDAPRARARLVRTLATDLEVGVDAATGYSDLARDVHLASRTSLESLLTGQAVTGDVYVERRAEVFLDRTPGRSRQSVSVFWVDRDFEIVDEGDDTVTGIRARWARGLSPTMTLGLRGSYIYTDYENPSRTDRDTYLTVDLTRQMRRNLAGFVGVGWNHRNSSEAPSDYDEAIVYLGIEYRRY